MCSDRHKLVKVNPSEAQHSNEQELNEFMGKCNLTELLGQCIFFDRNCSVSIDSDVSGDVTVAVGLEEVIQEKLLSHGACLLNLHEQVCVIIHHEEYFVVVEVGLSQSVAASIDAGCSDVKHGCTSGPGISHLPSQPVATSDDVGCSDVRHGCTSGPGVSHLRAIHGSFHQGHAQFRHAGKQCMAVSLVGMTLHNLHSVLTWNSETLDEVCNGRFTVF